MNKASAQQVQGETKMQATITATSTAPEAVRINNSLMVDHFIVMQR